MEIKGSVHFSIGATDLDKSQEFYVDKLGFELVARVERYIFLRANKDYFAVAQSHVHHAFLVDDYEETKEFLAGRGVEVFREDERDFGPFAGHSMYLHDPDRNVIEFIQCDNQDTIHTVSQT